MLVIPSIDLETDRSRPHASSVVETVVSWEVAGFARIHLDLGPVEFRSPEERVLEGVLREAHCTTQLAGRFGGTEEIDTALTVGADFVVLSDRALDDLDWLASVAARFPGQLLLASPARERRARSRGAVRTWPLDLRDLAAEVGALPLAAMIVDFPADSPLGHAELALLEDVTEEVEFPVQVSGGSPDLGTVRDLEFRGVGAVIIGQAHLSASFDGQMLARSFAD